jgi:hypothetical protein
MIMDDMDDMDDMDGGSAVVLKPRFSRGLTRQGEAWASTQAAHEKKPMTSMREAMGFDWKGT